MRYERGVRVAHFSDLHLLDLTGAVPGRLFNKRFTGWVNLRLHREHKHKPEPVRLGARALRALSVDHVVVTGDVSNLSLEREFDLARALFEDDMGLSPDQISVVPGNHDAYTRGAVRSRRFLRWFHDYTSSDLALDDDQHFPFVRLRGPIAVIGLSTAVARPPLIAAGHLGKAQLERLEQLLAHPEVRRRTPVILQHHPPLGPDKLVDFALKGLWDAKRELAVLDQLARGLVLHGHNHERTWRAHPTSAGSIDVLGATSASLLHDHERRVAGFNVYDFADDGALAAVETHRFESSSRSFTAGPLSRN